MPESATRFSNQRVVVMAGGTGGHVFPGLAVARAFMAGGATVTWLGTRNGIEARLVPAEGIEIDWLSVTGLRGKGRLTLLLAPFKLLIAAWQAARVMQSRKPTVVIGMGGFASGPGGLMARLFGRPLVVHEQNAIAGLTNRLLARVANRVLEAFPGVFPPAISASGKVVMTGNPVRAEFFDIGRREQQTGASEPLKLLVVGGSLGAKALNETVPNAVAAMSVETRPQVRHQTGKRTFDLAQRAYQAVGVDAELCEFIEDMGAAYDWADLVICRAGALTVAELAAVGVASVLVPYPYAVDDHQAANAAYLSENGAALLIREAQLDAATLTQLLNEFAADRARLRDMAGKARALALPNATRDVVENCLAVAKAAARQPNDPASKSQMKGLKKGTDGDVK